MIEQRPAYGHDAIVNFECQTCAHPLGQILKDEDGNRYMKPYSVLAIKIFGCAFVCCMMCHKWSVWKGEGGVPLITLDLGG
jgi:hypothetical protein